jgi:hypothetical protein
MRRHFVPCLAALAIAACNQGSASPPPPPTTPDNVVVAPAPTYDPPVPTGTAPITTTTPDAGPPPEWTPPVLPTRSGGCGIARADANGVLYTTPSGRTFHVWGPPNYDKDKAHNVVYTYHGIQTNGLDFESWFKMEDYVQDEAFVVYPDAAGGYWDLGGDSDLTFFDEMSKMMNDTYCTDPSRAFGFGFSYGGIFMNRLGCKRAGYVKAISIGDGSGNPGTSCGRLPVLFTARTADQNETVAGARADAAHWQTVNGCTAATTVSNASMNCVSNTSCKAPGALTFCEDTFRYSDYPSQYPEYDPSWDHTVREPYRAFTYSWFAALP